MERIQEMGLRAHRERTRREKFRTRKFLLPYPHIGSGEMNVLVHTNNPRSAFEKAKRLLFLMGHLPEMKAGYGDSDEDDYTPIWPAELDQFAVK